MAGRLEGKVAIITGGTSGIGKASAELFAEEGAKVVFSGRREENGKAIESELVSKGHDVKFVKTDVTKLSDLENLVKQTIDTYGTIDILFNNAGVSLYKHFVDLTIEEFDNIMNSNIRSMFQLTQLVVPVMIENGGGKIVNTSSIGGVGGNELLTPYCASKGAVKLFTKCLAQDLAKHNIRANSLMPGLTLSEMTEGNDEFIEMASSGLPLKRAAQPKEIAYGALFMASDESSFMTGADLIIDGGFTSG